MNTKVIADSKVYLQSFEPNKIEKKNLDIKKLRILLNKLGFRPVNLGTTYITDSLEYIFNNNLIGTKKLKIAYDVVAQKHHTTLHNVEWDIGKAIDIMNLYADPQLLHEIFYWYNKKEKITPRTFMSAMIDYLNENVNEYKK